MRIYTVFQPICDLISNDTLGYEALIRGTDSPESLFENAIRKNNLLQLESEAIQSAFKLFQRKSMLLVNCHPLSFPYIYPLVCKALIKYQHIYPHQLCVELTEHKAVSSIKDIKHQVRLLKRMGIRIALDDFGHGYTDLSLVQAVQTDYIKLDKSLTKNIVKNSIDRKLLSGIRKLADEVDTKIIAEGVETKEQMRLILESGIRFGQGFLLGRPQVLEEVSV